jgi:hypothetical protein
MAESAHASRSLAPTKGCRAGYVIVTQSTSDVREQEFIEQLSQLVPDSDPGLRASMQVRESRRADGAAACRQRCLVEGGRRHCSDPHHRHKTLPYHAPLPHYHPPSTAGGPG